MDRSLLLPDLFLNKFVVLTAMNDVMYQQHLVMVCANFTLDDLERYI